MQIGLSVPYIRYLITVPLAIQVSGTVFFIQANLFLCLRYSIFVSFLYASCSNDMLQYAFLGLRYSNSSTIHSMQYHTKKPIHIISFCCSQCISSWFCPTASSFAPLRTNTKGYNVMAQNPLNGMCLFVIIIMSAKLSILFHINNRTAGNNALACVAI